MKSLLARLSRISTESSRDDDERQHEAEYRQSVQESIAKSEQRLREQRRYTREAVQDNPITLRLRARVQDIELERYEPKIR